jgi:hypothetical protein
MELPVPFRHHPTLTEVGLLPVLWLLGAGCTPPAPPPSTPLDTEPARLVEAFFGLDNALPVDSRGLCLWAPGKDGMPVTFSRRLVMQQPEPSAFLVRTRAGREHRPVCATTRPADGPLENHTVLLMGDLGDDANDPPMEVVVTGDVPFQGGGNARGLQGPVRALQEGPTLTLAMAFSRAGLATDCPEAAAQVVMVVWAGGVVPGPGKDQESHRLAYRVLDAQGPHVPLALGDLQDRDNYVHLCMESALAATEVTAAEGVLVDPRGDLNPFTRTAVYRALE